MGYKSRVYFVRKSEFTDADGRRWADVIASINLDRFPGVYDVFFYSPVRKETDCYFYHDDGMTEADTDINGEKMMELPCEEFLAGIEQLDKIKKVHPHAGPLLAMAQAFASDPTLTVLHYGY